MTAWCLSNFNMGMPLLGILLNAGWYSVVLGGAWILCF